MALLASVVIGRVRQTLLDAAGVTWSDNELIAHLNAGITQLVALKPDTLPVETGIAMVAGVAQTLPANGVLFMDCLRNSVGNAVTVQPIHEFIRTHPTWGSDTPDAATEFVLFDPRLPRNFWVWPPAPVSTQILVLQGTLPTRVAALTDAIGVPDFWESALWAYVIACARAKNSKLGDLAKTQAFMSMFMAWVTGTTQAIHATGGKPDIKGNS